MDGVVLCHLANHIRPRSVASIHVPSPAVVSHLFYFCCILCENKFSKFSGKKSCIIFAILTGYIPHFNFFSRSIKQGSVQFSYFLILESSLNLFQFLFKQLLLNLQKYTVLYSPSQICDENLISCLYSLNSVWQSAEEMLKTFLMLVKNWVFHRYANCFIN